MEATAEYNILAHLSLTVILVTSDSLRDCLDVVPGYFFKLLFGDASSLVLHHLKIIYLHFPGYSNIMHNYPLYKPLLSCLLHNTACVYGIDATCTLSNLPPRCNLFTVHHEQVVKSNYNGLLI